MTLLGSITSMIRLGLHTGTRLPIGTEIHLEKNPYFTLSLRTGTKRHRFVFEYRFVYNRLNNLLLPIQCGEDALCADCRQKSYRHAVWNSIRRETQYDVASHARSQCVVAIICFS